MLEEVVREVHFYGKDSAMIPELLRDMVDDLGTAAADHVNSSVERARRILDAKKTEPPA